MLWYRHLVLGLPSCHHRTRLVVVSPSRLQEVYTSEFGFYFRACPFPAFLAAFHFRVIMMLWASCMYHARPRAVCSRIGSNVGRLSPPVFWLHERHRGDDGFPQLVPHLNFNLRSLLVPSVLNVPHSNILLQGWGWDSRRDGSDEVAR